MNKISNYDYYMKIADVVSERSTCLRRHYGAVIVKDDRIISTGYNGAPIGEESCGGIGECHRDILNIPHGERYELCRAVHAEANAIMSAREDLTNSTIYVHGRDTKTGKVVKGTPCKMCARLIKNAKIKIVCISEDEI